MNLYELKIPVCTFKKQLLTDFNYFSQNKLTCRHNERATNSTEAASRDSVTMAAAEVKTRQFMTSHF
jgi:hypothetical protein